MSKIIFLGLVYFFFTVGPIKAATLGNVNQLIGGTVTYAGLESNLQITQPDVGVFEVRANSWACTPGIANCEPDRYQIDFTRNMPHIYGLGMVSSANKVELSDFLDVNFSSGHLDSPTERYEGDVGRMRTPIFVIPSENLIIAYIQPVVKSLRLTRTATSTSIVLKKYATVVAGIPPYVEGAPAPLLVIKGANPTEMYQKYYTYLKTHGFSFRRPTYAVFGLGWETFDEFGCTATYPDVTGAVSQFATALAPLTFSIIGSGYWDNDDLTAGCGTAGDTPTTDTLRPSSTRYQQYGGLAQLLTNLRNQGIAPALGMRLNVKPSNVTFIQNQFAARGITSGVFLDSNIYYGNSPSNIARVLNIQSANIVNTFIDLAQSAYGPFRGIKEDEMFFGDQAHTRLALPNFPDGMVSKSYPRYYQRLGNDFFIIGRNDWFSVQADGNASQGYVDAIPSGWTGYPILKPLIDSALVQVVSGYPHPMIEPAISYPSDYHNNSQKAIPSWQYKEYLRTRALQTFLPIDAFSRGFWHVADINFRDAVIFFARLRTRLHHYAFDQSQKWFETGVPHLMQPLFIRFNEAAIATLYTAPTSPNDARDEFMFGNALLVRPLFSDADTIPVYLPTGRWRTFLKASPALSGGQYINYSIANALDFPVFLKEGEILIIADPANLQNLQAYVFLDTITQGTVYTFYKTDTVKFRLQAVIENGQVKIKNLDTNQTAATVDDAFGKGFKIADINTLVQMPVPVDLKLLLSNWLRPGPCGSFNCDLFMDQKINAFDAAVLINNLTP